MFIKGTKFLDVSLVYNTTERGAALLNDLLEVLLKSEFKSY